MKSIVDVVRDPPQGVGHMLWPGLPLAAVDGGEILLPRADQKSQSNC